MRNPDGPPEQELARFNADWRDTVAQRWARTLSSASYIPLSRQDVEQSLRDILDTLLDALAGNSEVELSGQRVGARLVEMHATGEDSLALSLRLLRDELLPDEDARASGVLVLLTAVAAGYVAADRESTFQQQETLKRALLRSKLQADRDLAVSEKRFSEVFSSTPVGVAICTLDGMFLQVNPALENNMGYRAGDLAKMRIHDLFHPEDAADLTAAYSDLVQSGGSRRLAADRKRLVCSNGEQAWVYLAISVLGGRDGEPQNAVIMIEDVTELHMLQQRFQYQALHDALTGLPNRQYFGTRLESALVNMPKSAHLTLYHLGLDSFDLINDGLGYAAGDEVIKVVAGRLSELVEGETSLVARFGGTEFAVLVCETANTPATGDFVAMLNRSLAEPIYLDEQGVAASANIGVVRQRVDEADTADMLWAADVALRRAEATGKRQWALFDPDRAPEERTRAKLAATMPGGLRLGEMDVLYRPLSSLDTGELVAVEAEIIWETAEHGRVTHRDCLRLAERSGVVLPLRDWMFTSVWEQLQEWHAEGYSARALLTLSENQAGDPDLISAVRAVLRGTELNPHWLRLCVPVSALLADGGAEARENVCHLRDHGIHAVLHGFRGTPEELAMLRELPVDMVWLESELVRIVHASASVADPEVRAVRQVVLLVHELGACVCVRDVDTQTQARLWRELGCRVAGGKLFGDAVLSFDVPSLLDELMPARTGRADSETR